MGGWGGGQLRLCSFISVNLLPSCSLIHFSLSSTSFFLFLPFSSKSFLTLFLSILKSNLDHKLKKPIRNWIKFKYRAVCRCGPGGTSCCSGVSVTASGGQNLTLLVDLFFHLWALSWFDVLMTSSVDMSCDVMSCDLLITSVVTAWSSWVQTRGPGLCPVLLHNVQPG